MIMTQTTGVDIVKHYLPELRRGKFRVLLLFLASGYDHTLLQDVQSLARDLDLITGPHCLAVLFAPPSPDNPYGAPPPGALGFWSAGRHYSFDQWDQFVDVMTRNTYALASLFHVPSTDLPCLLFVDTAQPDRLALLRLSQATLREVFPKLRSLFERWYAENRSALDAFLLKSVLSDELAETGRAKRLVEEALRQTAYPVMADACAKLIEKNNSLDVGRMRRALKKLYDQPRNTQPLEQILQEKAVSLRIDGINTDAKHLRETYFALLKSRHSFAAAKNDYDDGIKTVTPFPFEEITSWGRVSYMQHLTRSSAEQVKRVKPLLDIAVAILKLFGIPA